MPFGNAFLVQTPKLDQLSQRLWMEGKQRELQHQQNAKALDDEFSKNVTNIRDADVDELTSAYQKYKTSAQSAMKTKGGVSPQQQMEVLKSKAEMYKLINESKAEREREEADAKRYYVKPDDFNDNAYQLMMEGRKLPLSKKRTYAGKDEKGNPITLDLTNRENYMWQDKTNWQPILQKAGGTLTQRGKPVEVELPGGLEKEVTTYKGGNDPLEYYANLVGAMNTARASQSLATRYNFTPAEAQDITLKFEELKKNPDFKNAYGDIVFPESSNATEGTRTAKLLAMTNAINNPPVADKPVRIKNTKDIIDYRFDNQKTLAAIKQLYATANIKLAAGVRGSSGEMTVPPKDGENYDLTERFQGLKVGNLAGSPEVAKIGSKILYNPNTKTISYKDFAGKEYTKSFQQFYDDIATINTVQDLKIVKEVMNSIETPKTVQKNKPVTNSLNATYKTFITNLEGKLSLESMMILNI